VSTGALVTKNIFGSQAEAEARLAFIGGLSKATNIGDGCSGVTHTDPCTQGETK
jgi:hypothetical protein